MSKTIKACMICNNFTVDLGDTGYSEYTPGYPGSIRCRMDGYKDCPWKKYHVSSDYWENAKLITVAEECPYFELHKDIAK